MRLHIDQGNLVEVLELVGGDRLDLEVQQLDHPQVLGPRHRLQATNHRGLARPSQDGAQRQAAGHGIWVWVVVREN